MLRKILTFLFAFIVLAPGSGADSLTAFNSFTSGTGIQSTPVNQNFSYITTWSTAIANDNIKAGAAINPTKLDLTAEFPILRAAAARCVSAGTTGDTVHRWTVTSDGDVFFGPGGSSALDLKLTRVDGNTLGLKNATTTYKNLALANVVFKTASFDLIETAASVATANRTVTKRDPGADVDAAYLTSGATATKGGIAVGTGNQSTIDFTAVGTSGHVLTSNGAGSLPTFQAPASAVSKFTNTAKSANFTAGTTSFTMYRIDTSGGAVTVDLSASPADGTILGFVRTAGTNKFILDANGAEVVNYWGISNAGTLDVTSGVVLLQAVTGGYDVH